MSPPRRVSRSGSLTYRFQRPRGEPADLADQGITITLSTAATAGGANELTFTSIQTGTLTNGQSTILSIGSPATLGAGRPVTASGIPAGTTIVSIDQNGTIGLSSPATAAGSQSLTFAPATGVIPSFDIDQSKSFDFDPSVQTAGLNGARVYFFVVPNSWPATARRLGSPALPPILPASRTCSR